MNNTDYKILRKDAHTFKYQIGHAVTYSNKDLALKLIKAAYNCFSDNSYIISDQDYKEVITDFYKFLQSQGFSEQEMKLFYDETEIS